MKSSWCKSSPVKAVAGRPVASVAIRWVTDGCEAYTASKQAARIQLRNRPHCDADAVRRPGGVAGIAGVASPGHAYQGISRETRRAPCFSAYLGPAAPNPKPPGLRGEMAAPVRSEQPLSGISCCQGKPEAQVGGTCDHVPI